MSTQAAKAIDGLESAYHLDLHQMTYRLGNDLVVYPDPDGPDDSQFAVRDCVVDVTFINPPKDDDGAWDYGILFGPTSDGGYYRMFVTSTGEWFLTLDAEIVRQGEIEGLQVDYRERNTLRFIVSGGRMILYLDNQLVASARLDQREPEGQLWLATSNKDSSDIAFLDLDVWSIP